MAHDFHLLIVGSGLYGSVVAQQAKEYGLSCLVLERRQQVGGNIRDEWTEGFYEYRIRGEGGGEIKNVKRQPLM